MHRAFFSLYFLIVASVVVVGWGLDELWHFAVEDQRLSEQDKDLMALAHMHLRSRSGLQVSGLDELNAQLDAQVDVLFIDDFAQSNLKQSLEKGETVALNNQAGERRLYRAVPDTKQVIALTLHHKRSAGALNKILVVLFYGAIALAVFFWVWPLSRDLRKLEVHTKLVGQDDVPSELHFSPASPVYDLANAFNKMSRRIKGLLASHQEMTNAVSHELRTPLARMKFGLEIASSAQKPEQLELKLAGLREDVQEMETLVNELLTYAGFEQSQQSLNVQAGDMSALVRELMQRLIHQYPNSSIELALSNEGHEQGMECEWHLMERAIFNLLQNALRFAQTKVQVSLNQADDYYEICVDDDGPGIPQEERERVLQSFVRLNNHANAQKRGFGLGLSIVMRILAWHQGQLFVESAPLGGARLRMIWPKKEKP